MRVIYAEQAYPSFQDEQILFLVGPTPRNPNVESWRPKALGILRDLGYDGLVFSPEPEDGNWSGDYVGQILWEYEGLEACALFGCIAAWVPRDLENMPAFTTNIEFGLHVASGRLLYGRPPRSPKNRYLDWMYNKKTGRMAIETLEELMAESVEMLRE